MRPKEWLAKNGHIDNPNQRGRLSKDHTALIEAAVRDGAKIDGYSVTPALDTGSPTAPFVAKVERTSVDPNRIADVPEARRPDTDWVAHIYVDGEKTQVGMRTVCNVCHNSLTYCYCTQPQVNHIGLDTEAQAMVTFTMSKSPMPKWW